MRYCIDRATEYAVQRKQFGNTIASFGNIQEKLARMQMLHYMTEVRTDICRYEGSLKLK